MSRMILPAALLAAACLSLPVRTAHAIEECSAMRHTVHVIDGEAAPPPEFRRYVDDMTAYLAAFSPGGSCAGASDIYFIYTPLVGSAPAVPGPSGGMHLHSPWVETGRTRIVFQWNERQLLMDQALLAGAKPTGITALAPIDQATFDAYVEDYSQAVLTAAAPDDAGVAARTPPDVLWLLRHAGQSTRGPFGNAVQSAMARTNAKAAEAFTTLSQAVVARCPAAGQPDVTYPTVFAVSGVFSTEAYRIERLN